VIQPTRRR